MRGADAGSGFGAAGAERPLAARGAGPAASTTGACSTGDSGSGPDVAAGVDAIGAAAPDAVGSVASVGSAVFAGAGRSVRDSVRASPWPGRAWRRAGWCDRRLIGWERQRGGAAGRGSSTLGSIVVPGG